MDAGYHDVTGEWQRVPEDALADVLAAMEAEGEGPPADPPVRVVRAGSADPVDGPCQLDLEDGATVRVDGHLPPDLPLGYHRLTRLDDGAEVRLIAGPGRCFLPEGLRVWGWSVQLPSLRSARSWGMGDLGDLRDLARWSRQEMGAGLLLLNPLHAAAPGLPQEASPYSPSSRRWRNPLYIRIEDVPGFDEGDPRLAELAAEGRRLTAGGRLIDRDAVYRAKLAALEHLWPGQPGEAFESWRQAQGEDLAGFATWCVLAEQGDRPLPHPASAEVARVRSQRADRLRFHEWLQWLLDRQLAAAGAEIDLMQDLAVGFSPDGADAWQWQDVTAEGARVGAPPDEFNRAGQDWGLPPFIPWKLQQAGYEPFVRTVRAGFRHAGGLRVDHVMGLFRQFWVPLGRGPREGAYVRFPWSDLLEILALESVRAGAYVVGEDLGTVEDHVRHELAARDVLSYRLLWFEPAPPEQWPEQALAAVTTHDLPTVAGLWTGADRADQAAAGVTPNEEGEARLRDRLAADAGVAPDAPVDEVVEAAYRLLARAPSAIVCATVEDALGVPERPNLPGTMSDARPNWSMALPVSLEDIQADPRPRRLAAIVARDGR